VWANCALVTFEASIMTTMSGARRFARAFLNDALALVASVSPSTPLVAATATTTIMTAVCIFRRPTPPPAALITGVTFTTRALRP
jgi:hypothetical protein